VEFVEDVQIRIAGSGDGGAQPATSGKVSVARDAVIWSQQHEVLVR
jgi:hypothetical protein